MFITYSSIAFGIIWIIEGKYKEKLQILWHRKSPLYLVLIYVIFVVGTLRDLPHTAAWNYLWGNLPLLIFALAIGSMPALNHRQFHSILIVFIVSFFLNTLFSFSYFMYNYEGSEDIRTLSIFMSYIRYSLFVLLALASTAYLLFFKQRDIIRTNEKIFLWIALFWFIFFIVILSSITGLIGLCVLFFMITFSLFIKQKQILLKLIPIIFLSIICGILVYLVARELRYFTQPETVHIETLDTHTANGNPYYDYTPNGQLENGNWVNLYVCDTELYENWQLYSSIPLSGFDKKGHYIYHTLKRYMTSKGLRKDAEGLQLLSQHDIRNIELGITNYRFDSFFKISHRIYEVFWEFHNYEIYKISAGLSVVQRFEFLKCSSATFLQYFWTGTGIVNLSKAMDEQYAQSTTLPRQYWKYPHNQYMLIAVQFGIFGIAFFILSLVGLCRKVSLQKNLLSLFWFSMSVISFFNEDTLTALTGLVFFSFWGSILLNIQPNTHKKIKI